MSDDKKQQFNIYLRSDLIREVKHAAVDARETLSDFVAEALEAHMRQKKGEAEETFAPVPTMEREETKSPTGLTLMAIVYVRDVAAAMPFYQALGFVPAAISRAGEWAELRRGDAVLALHQSDQPSSMLPRGVELSFISHEPLESFVERLAAAGFPTQHPIVDEEYGRNVLIQAPDGFTMQVDEYDPELYT
jgi:hypothetical protein